jgi:hypothetical protein
MHCNTTYNTLQQHCVQQGRQTPSESPFLRQRRKAQPARGMPEATPPQPCWGPGVCVNQPRLLAMAWPGAHARDCYKHRAI